MQKRKAFSQRSIVAVYDTGLGEIVGPLGLVIGWAVIRARGDPLTAFPFVAICYISTLVVSIQEVRWLKHRQGELRGRNLAIFAIVSCVSWAIITITIIEYILSQTN